MKRFHFTLESVQKLRRLELESEEAKLAPMYREMEALEESERQIRLEVAREQTRLADPSVALQSFDFELLDQFRQFATRRAVQLQSQKLNCQRRIEAQLLRIGHAKQKHELLEKLRLRGLAEWHARWNKEIDALAEEVFIAAWKPRRSRPV